jgi:hypothetical protein
MASVEWQIKATRKALCLPCPLHQLRQKTKEAAFKGCFVRKFAFPNHEVAPASLGQGGLMYLVARNRSS